MQQPFRWQALASTLKSGEAGLITQAESRLYITGEKTTAGQLLVLPSNAFLLIDFRYFEKVRQKVKALGITPVLLERDGKQLQDLLEENQIKRLFLETSRLSFEQVTALQTRLGNVVCTDPDFDRSLADLRSRKQSYEIERIQKAQQITDAAFAHICNFLRPGRTEREVALELEFFGRKQGAEGVSFDFIVVSGPKSALPHGSPDDKVIKNGEFVTMDFGFVVEGYGSDMTRTVAIGHANEKMCLVYDTVLNAQLTALACYKPGITGGQADKAARDVIEKAGFGHCFGHGLGHGVGIEIHEAPTAGPNSKQILCEGMTLTCEPGIYLANEFGVRIEDMGYFTKDGFVNITKSKKELLVL